MDFLHFASFVSDPRVVNRSSYPLDLILLIVFSSTLAGCRAWDEMEDYAKRFHMDIEEIYNHLHERSVDPIHFSRMPSHDTLNRIFQLIDPKEFFAFYKAFVEHLFKEISGQVISIDGKTMRGVSLKEKISPTHIVSAFNGDEQFVLAQKKIAVKGKELEAIRELLKFMDIEQKVITIDAIGTQKDITESIIKKSADYVLPVKGNQKGLLEEIRDTFRLSKKDKIQTYKEDIQYDHGRIETRQTSIIKDFDDLSELKKWTGVKAIVQLERSRNILVENKQQTETVYFISSLDDPKNIHQSIRKHWSVENKLHYMLDVITLEDKSLKRKDNVPENINTLNKLLLLMLYRRKLINKKSIHRNHVLLYGANPAEIFNTKF